MIKKILVLSGVLLLTAFGRGAVADGTVQVDLANVAPAAALVTLPGIIEAELFESSNGIRTGNTNDSGGSEFVGWIENNDYTEYEIDVPVTGSYKLDARVASRNQGATVSVTAGNSVAGSFAVSPTGDWEAWETVSTILNLSEGTQMLRLSYLGEGAGLMNINWFSLSLDEPPPESDVRLDSSGWTLFATHNTNDTFLAIDGDINTRWATRELQNAGQQITISLNAFENFDRLILDSSESGGDYPREYQVAISDDGTNWENIAAGTGTLDGVTSIYFAGEQSASYLRVTQLGSASRNWWSIHELSLFANSSDAPPPSGDGVVDVFMVTGQSNTKREWSDAIEERLNELSDQELVVVMERHPGNRLEQWWDNGAQENFNHDVDVLEDVFDEIRALSKEPRLRGFFWFQGESDSRSEDLVEVYEDSFIEYTSAFFDNFDESNVPVAIAVVDRVPTDDGNEGMRSVLFDLGRDMLGFAFDTRDYDRSDAVHVTLSDLDELGKDMADRFHQDFLR